MGVIAWGEALPLSGTPITGRSVYTYATFDNVIANTMLWSATEPVPLRNAFATSGPLYDKYMFNSMCSLSSAADNGWNSTSELTLESTGTGWAPGLTTADINGATIQTAGCSCPSMVLAEDDSLTELNGCQQVSSSFSPSF